MFKAIWKRQRTIQKVKEMRLRESTTKEGETDSYMYMEEEEIGPVDGSLCPQDRRSGDIMNHPLFLSCLSFCPPLYNFNLAFNC